MFGEMLGVCLAQCWLDHGARALRAGRTRPRPGHADGRHPAGDGGRAGVPRAAAHLVEVSPPLRARQAEALGLPPPGGTTGSRTCPPCPSTSSPTSSSTRSRSGSSCATGDGWAERVIGAEGDRLIFGLAAPAPLACSRTGWRHGRGRSGGGLGRRRGGGGGGGRAHRRGTAGRRCSWTTAAGGRGATRSRRCARTRASTRSTRRGRRT
jgi:hypothetical protein